jgi:hypothetical protein
MTNGNGLGHTTGKEPVERAIDLFVHMPIGFAVMAWKRVPEFVVSVPEIVGQVVAKGCAQLAGAEERLSEEVRKARMIGQVALTFGGRQVRREVDARLADARRKAEGVAAFIPGMPGIGGTDGRSNGAGARPGTPPVSAAATPTAPSSPAGPAQAATKPVRARPATKSPTAAKATKTTKAAKPSAAKATAAAKSPRRAGSRTSGAASAADLPIREYDGLSASQVVSRLTGLTPDELRSVRAYEEGSRGRRTVLLAIDRLLG